MYSHDRHRHEREKLFSVFVGHINGQVTKEDLRELFSGSGNVLDCCVLPDEKGGEYKYGFIRYGTAEEAKKAIKEVNGWPLRGTRLIVDVSKDTKHRIQQDQPVELTHRKFQALESIQKIPDPESSKSCLDRIVNLSRVKEACSQVNMGMRTQRSSFFSLIDTIETSGGAELLTVTDLPMARRVNGKVNQSNSCRMIVELERKHGIAASQMSKIYAEKFDEIDRAVCRIIGSQCTSSMDSRRCLPESKESNSQHDLGYSSSADSSPNVNQPPRSLSSNLHKSIFAKHLLKQKQSPSGSPEPQLCTNNSPPDDQTMNAAARFPPERTQNQNQTLSPTNQRLSPSTHRGKRLPHSGGHSHSGFGRNPRTANSTPHRNVSQSGSGNSPDLNDCSFDFKLTCKDRAVFQVEPVQDIRMCGVFPEPGQLKLVEAEEEEVQPAFGRSNSSMNSSLLSTGSDSDEEQMWEVSRHGNLKKTKKIAEELFLEMMEEEEEESLSPLSSSSSGEKMSEDSRTDDSPGKVNPSESPSDSSQEAASLTRMQKLALLAKSRR